MSVRPIDANALLEAIGELKLSPWYNGENGNYERMIRSEAIGIVEDLCIKSAPNLDYAPRQQWISVKDRLPEEEKEVLCYLGNSLSKSIVVAFGRHGKWYFDGWICPTVTHWMPLPEAPKEET